jgi:hypothetical protein
VRIERLEATHAGRARQIFRRAHFTS